MFDVIIIGAGVVGALIACKLSEYNLKICVVDAREDCATGASGANSGISHAGFDAAVGSQKAKFNVRGAALMPDLCARLGVKYKNVGSLVVGFGEEDAPALNELCARGLSNGVSGLQLLGADALHRLEPGVSPSADRALWAPTAGIVCPYGLTIAALGLAMDNGAEFMPGFKVENIERIDGGYSLHSGGGTVCGAFVVNSAGLYSDEVARMVGDSSFTVTPRRGEYVLLDREFGSLVSHTVFRVPSKMGKGVLVSPTADGNLILGPTSENITNKSDTSTTSTGLERLTALAAQSVPGIRGGAVTSFTGLRAVGSTGDFIIKESSERFITLGGIESPGLTSSPAIAEYFPELLFSLGLPQRRKESPILTRAPAHFFAELSLEEKNELIIKDSSYGRIVCRCESITEGEILAALDANPHPTTVDGVKRRVRAGMGRCQGGFCSPRVMRLISERLGIPFEQVTKRGQGSEMVTGRTK